MRIHIELGLYKRTESDQLILRLLYIAPLSLATKTVFKLIMIDFLMNSWFSQLKREKFVQFFIY